VRELNNVLTTTPESTMVVTGKRPSFLAMRRVKSDAIIEKPKLRSGILYIQEIPRVSAR